MLDSRLSISCFQISTTFLSSLSSPSLRSRHRASYLYRLNVSALSVSIKYSSICSVTKFCRASFLCFPVLDHPQHSSLKDCFLVPNFITSVALKILDIRACLRSPFGPYSPTVTSLALYIRTLQARSNDYAMAQAIFSIPCVSLYLNIPLNENLPLI
jgi:hypothetical protein